MCICVFTYGDGCVSACGVCAGWVALCVALVTVYICLYDHVYQSEDAVYVCLPACGG